MYSDAAFRYLMTTWVIKHHRPFTIVDDGPLREAFQMLFSKVKVPSANTVSRDVREVHRLSKANVIALLAVSIFYMPIIVFKTNVLFLQTHKGCFHIAFDGWTSPNVISYLGVVVTYAHNGGIRSFILDFIR
jgi:hypothetical protein